MHAASPNAIDEAFEQHHPDRVRIASALESQDDRARVLVDALLDRSKWRSSAADAPKNISPSRP